jgi:lipopolysaccharide export system protein LptA
MFPRVSAAALMLVTAAALSQAPTPTPAPPAAKAAPKDPMLRGPVKITAERAELDQKRTALYRGNVRLTSPDLELTGDRLELKQPARGQFEALLTGRPARLKHAGAGAAPAVAAQANQITYDTRTGTVDLVGVS